MLGLGWDDEMLEDFDKFLIVWYDIIVKIYFACNVVQINLNRYVL